MYLDDCVCVLPDLTWLPLLGVGRKSRYIIFTCAVCASEAYMRCFGRTSVYLIMRLLAARTSLYRMTLNLLLSMVSLWNGLTDPVFDGVGLPGFKGRADAVFVFYCFPFLSFYWLVLCGWSIRTDSL